MPVNGSAKAVLVTGASRGLGLASALRLASSGYRTFAGVRSKEAAAQVQASASRLGLSIETVQMDVTDDESTRTAVDSVVQAAGGLYGLVNNAGITGRAPFEEYPPDFIQRIFAVNVFGTMRVTRYVLPVLRTNRAGLIVFVTSVGGRIGSMSVAPYCASKFALEGFGESLYLEMKPFGVNVVLVAPGIIKTDIWSEDNRILSPAKNEASPYHDYFWNAERLTTKALNSSKLKVEDVAETIGAIFSSSNPKLRYVVGRRAAFILSLRRHLPGELFEKLYFGAILKRIMQNPKGLPGR